MISPRRSTASVRVERRRAGAARSRRDAVTVEEPLEIRLRLPRQGGAIEQSVAVTMRTPGDDFELAAGFLFTEGLVDGAGDVGEIRYCTGEAAQEYNIVSVTLRDPDAFDPASLTRNFYMTSSCGVCGKASLEAVEISGRAPLPDGGLQVAPAVLRSVPERLLAAQPVFDRTGGIHAAALLTPEGEITLLREDVGRHNAVDKAIGHELLEGRLPIRDRFLAVSGRSSFEIMQKALVAGIPMVVAVGAPSSLAVELARRFNMTLVGFARADGFNVYFDAARVADG
ncbi:MAG: formate dehydrogenase accessory sulfurtransferase FdhD [Gemmatimonadota bacterium]